MSFKAGNPDWELIDIEQLQNLPAIQWKLKNIKKLAKENIAKHKDSLDKLYKALYS